MKITEFVQDLCSVYSQKATPALFKAYRIALSEFDEQGLDAVFELIMKTHKGDFMPRPPEVRQMALKAWAPQVEEKDLIELGWQNFREIIRLGFYENFEYEDRAMCATILALGGRNHLCVDLIEGEENFLKGSFRSIYQVQLDTERLHFSQMQNVEFGQWPKNPARCLIRDRRPLPYLRELAAGLSKRGIDLEGTHLIALAGEAELKLIG